MYLLSEIDTVNRDNDGPWEHLICYLINMML